MSNAESVIASLAQKDQAGTPPQVGATSGNAESVIGQIAANGGKVPEAVPPPRKAEPSDFESEQDEVKREVESGESPSAAYMKPGQTASALSGMLTVGSTAGAFAPAASAGVGEELANGIKIFRDAESGQFVKAAGPSLVGRIPGILKSAYDWAAANPLKAYVIYKIADEAGIGPSGLKKVFHLFSGAGAE